MSIDYSAKVLVGCDYDELINGVSKEERVRIGSWATPWVENKGLDYCSPWYDSGEEDWYLELNAF